MMRRIEVLAVAAILAMGQAAMAQPSAQPSEKVEVTTAPGQAMATSTVTVRATVVAIDAPTRTVTLKNPKGKVMQLTVGEEARNFDQLKVGDVVVAHYKEALSLSLKKEGGPPSMNERETISRSDPGAKPGGTIGREVTVMADVVAVNTKSKKVTLKGPKGNTIDLTVEDPDQLKGIKKGDKVQAVYTEALAISVEPAAKP